VSEPKDDSVFARNVSTEAAHKLRAQREGAQGVWFGIGMSGLIGWSVAVPTLAGAMAGLWLDHRHPGMHSWTLALMAAGLVIGCFNAWHWVTQEDEDMHNDPGKKDE